MSAAEREAANEKDSEAKRASRESMIYLTACPGIIVHCHNVSCTGKGLSDDVADAIRATDREAKRRKCKPISIISLSRLQPPRPPTPPYTPFLPRPFRQLVLNPHSPRPPHPSNRTFFLLLYVFILLSQPPKKKAKLSRKKMKLKRHRPSMVKIGAY